MSYLAHWPHVKEQKVLVLLGLLAWAFFKNVQCIFCFTFNFFVQLPLMVVATLHVAAALVMLIRWLPGTVLCGVMGTKTSRDLHVVGPVLDHGAQTGHPGTKPCPPVLIHG